MRSQKTVKKKGRMTNRKSRAKNANKKLKKKQTAISRNPIFGDKWDSTKTIKQNLKNFGLSYDPNEVVADQSSSASKVEKVEVMEIDAAKQIAKLSKGQKKRARKAAQKTSKDGGVVPMLEKAALELEQRKASNSVVRAHKDEVHFCSVMIEKHGLDFEAMARDPDNIWQHTSNQIRKMVEKFKKTPAFRSTENMEI